MTQYKYSIIADPEGKGWDFAEKIYEDLCKKSDDFCLNKIIVKKFRDGEVKTKIECNVRKKECFFIHDSNKNPSKWFLELCLVNSTLRNSSAESIANIFPYMRFSRQDRKDESRVPISSKVVADVIEQYADRVLTLDLHNPSISGFYRVPFDNLYSYPIVINHIKNHYPSILDDFVVMSTDAGGAPRAKSFAKRANINDIAIGYKSREKIGEVESLKILGEIEGKNVLIIDDLIDSGGTLDKAAVEARKNGARNVYAYATHGLFSEGIDKVVQNLDKMLIGDTLKQNEHPKLEVISFASLFSEAIYRITHGESLSELFD